MKSIDLAKLSENYMKIYYDIIEKYQKSDIQQLVENLNEALLNKNMKQANECYNKILDWNFTIANLDGIRESLNGQYPYLHLPSSIMFTIVFNENEKKWKFNAES